MEGAYLLFLTFSSKGRKDYAFLRQSNYADLFLISHCLRQCASVLCELRTWQPPAARSATHTRKVEPPEAARSREELRDKLI